MKQHTWPVQGEKIYLRPPCENEITFIKTLWEDVDTMKAVGGPIQWTKVQYDNWYQKMVVNNPSNLYCLIFDFYHQPIGEISYRLNPRLTQVGELNLKIIASQRKRGYAKDALLTFLNFCFNHLDFQIMTDEIGFDNRVSQELFIKLGFKHYPKKSNHFWVEMDKNYFNERYGKQF